MKKVIDTLIHVHPSTGQMDCHFSVVKTDTSKSVHHLPGPCAQSCVESSQRGLPSSSACVPCPSQRNTTTNTSLQVTLLREGTVRRDDCALPGHLRCSELRITIQPHWQEPTLSQCSRMLPDLSIPGSCVLNPFINYDTMHTMQH